MARHLFSGWPARLLVLGSAAVLVGAAGPGEGFMAPAGTVAASQFNQLWLVTLITMIVVFPVLVGVPLLAWRYRYSNVAARYAPHWDFSALLEWPMWAIPFAVVVVLSVFVWADSYKLDPYRAIADGRAPLHVEVVGLDWKWLFIYPDYHIATVGQMAFPQDRPVSMTLTADTVMQSFMIPALVGQIYAMPGMVTKLNLKADRTGSYDGMNTQYNGDGFHNQHFRAVAMTPAHFSAWVHAVQQKGVALNQAASRVLAESSTPAQVHARFGNRTMPKDVTFFNGVASGFFTRVVDRYRDGKAVPPSRQPGAKAYDARLTSAQGLAE